MRTLSSYGAPVYGSQSVSVVLFIGDQRMKIKRDDSIQRVYQYSIHSQRRWSKVSFEYYYCHGQLASFTVVSYFIFGIEIVNERIYHQPNTHTNFHAHPKL